MHNLASNHMQQLTACIYTFGLIIDARSYLMQYIIEHIPFTMTNYPTFDMMNTFNELNRWCISNKSTVNAKKTNFILFHTNNKPILNSFSEITTEFMKIKRVNSFKYLGITLDETLNWSEHVSILCESLLKYFGIFNHIKYKVTPKIACQICYAFI